MLQEAAVNTLGGSKTIEIHSPTVLESRNPKSGCPQGHVSSEGSRREPPHASPASGDCQQSVMSLACGCVTPARLRFHMGFPLARLVPDRRATLPFPQGGELLQGALP